MKKKPIKLLLPILMMQIKRCSVKDKAFIERNLELQNVRSPGNKNLTK